MIGSGVGSIPPVQVESFHLLISPGESGSHSSLAPGTPARARSVWVGLVVCETILNSAEGAWGCGNLAHYPGCMTIHDNCKVVDLQAIKVTKTILILLVTSIFTSQS